MKTFWIILLTVVVTGGLVGGGVYLWQQNRLLKELADLSKTATISNQVPVTATPFVVPSVTITRDMTTAGNSPTDNTENFLLCTLGTLPGATVDYDKAKNYLSANLLNQFLDDSFIPMFYGIQDGPDTYEMKSQSISGDTATVRVDVLYGEMMEAWAFVLIKENGEWKINEFRNDAQ